MNIILLQRMYGQNCQDRPQPQSKVSESIQVLFVLFKHTEKCEGSCLKVNKQYLLKTLSPILFVKCSKNNTAKKNWIQLNLWRI